MSKSNEFRLVDFWLSDFCWLSNQWNIKINLGTTVFFNYSFTFNDIRYLLAGMLDGTIRVWGLSYTFKQERPIKILEVISISILKQHDVSMYVIYLKNLHIWNLVFDWKSVCRKIFLLCIILAEIFSEIPLLQTVWHVIYYF